MDEIEQDKKQLGDRYKRYYSEITGCVNMGWGGQISFQAVSECHMGLLSTETEV